MNRSSVTLVTAYAEWRTHQQDESGVNRTK